MRGIGGLTKDEKKAVELIQKAAALGNSNAMKTLAVCYENGIGGLSINKKMAKELR